MQLIYYITKNSKIKISPEYLETICYCLMAFYELILVLKTLSISKQSRRKLLVNECERYFLRKNEAQRLSHSEFNKYYQGLPQIVGNRRDLWDGTQKQSSG